MKLFACSCYRSAIVATVAIVAALVPMSIVIVVVVAVVELFFVSSSLCLRGRAAAGRDTPTGFNHWPCDLERWCHHGARIQRDGR